MSDEEAHSLLLLENEQSELTPLEKGKHAYEHIQMVGKGKGGREQEGGIREYARRHNYSSHAIVLQWMEAYSVVKTGNNVTGLGHRVLYEISKAPEEAWQALCQAAMNEEWTVEQAKRVSSRIERNGSESN